MSTLRKSERDILRRKYGNRKLSDIYRQVKGKAFKKKSVNHIPKKQNAFMRGLNQIRSLFR